MLAEDKLTRGEHLRLESLNMAINTINLPTNAQIEDFDGSKPTRVSEELLFLKAEQIEAWLRRADEDHMKGSN